MVTTVTLPDPPFQLHTVLGRLVQPGLDLDRTSAILSLDDELQFSKLDRRATHRH